MLLRQIATRVDLPQTVIPFKQLNGRRAHIARDEITAVSAGYPNWFSIEHPGPSLATIYASIEYPLGTFTRLTWYGETSEYGTIEAGTTGFTDLTRLIVSIPNGSTFWTHVFWQSMGGALVNHHAGTTENVLAGDVCQIAASGLADQSMISGIAENGGGRYYYGPCALLGMTERCSVAFIADSRAYGEGDENDSTLDRGELARSLGATAAYMNLSCCADRAMWWPSRCAQRLALARYCSHAIVQLGANDIFEAGRLAVDLLADRSLIFGLLTGMTIFETTIAPETNSTNTAMRSEAYDAERETANAAFRHGSRGISGCFDIASAVEASGLWASITYQCGDGVHESGAGYRVIKNAGVIDLTPFRSS